MNAEFRDFGPVPWWCWTGSLKKTEMLRQLNQMKNVGIDEFFIYAVYGLKYPRFLEESWFDYVEFILKEAEKRNMRVWFCDDLNWPSGTAAGLMVKEHPEYRSRSIYSNLLRLPPGDKYFYSIGAAPLAVFKRNPGEKNWIRVECPDNCYHNDSVGELELLVLDIRFYNYTMLTSQGISNTKNYRGYCDFMNPEAVKCWMSYIHDRYWKRFSNFAGRVFKGFFYDEPFLMHYRLVPGCNQLPWTPGLFEKFQTVFGYDLIDKLPLLLYDGEMAATESVRDDFWNMVTELMAEAFSRTIADWCEKRGLLSTGHCVGEEISNQRFRLLFNGEIHRLLKPHQIPGMDLLNDNCPYLHNRESHWYGNAPKTERNFIFTAKQACSTARYTGAKRVMAEAMGVCSPSTSLNREKMIFDWLAGNGISMLNENCLTYTQSGFLKRALSNKHWTQPWFKHYKIFSEYCRKMSQFATAPLQADVAVLVCESTIRGSTPAAFEEKLSPEINLAEAMLSTLDSLMRGHIDFELMFEDILTESTFLNGKLLAPNSEFSVLVVPGGWLLSVAIAEKLASFIRAGGKLLFVDTRPVRICGKELSSELRTIFDKAPLLKLGADFPARLLAALQLDLRYTLNGENTQNIFSALRGNTLLLSNQGNTKTRFSVNCQLPFPVTAHGSGNDDAWDFKAPEIELFPEQSILLEYGRKTFGTPPAAYQVLPKQEKLRLSDVWEYKLDRPNNAICQFELGLAPNAESENPEQVKCWIPVSRDGCHGLEFSPEECQWYWLQSKFTLDTDLTDLSLVVDTDDYDLVILNGKPIAIHTSYTLWDHLNVKFDLASALRRGINSLLIRGRTSPWSSPRLTTHIDNSIEPVVLHGNFAAELKDGKTMLTALPGSLITGNLHVQGFPQYLGEILYHQKFSARPGIKRLFLPEVNAGSTEVRLNGVSLGTRLWGPYIFDCRNAIRVGENTLEVVLTGRLGDMLPRSYGNQKFSTIPLGIGKSVLMY